MTTLTTNVPQPDKELSIENKTGKKAELGDVKTEKSAMSIELTIDGTQFTFKVAKTQFKFTLVSDPKDKFILQGIAYGYRPNTSKVSAFVLKRIGEDGY